MNYKVVKSSELGTNCWSAKRFCGECYRCQLYGKCKYPQRIANKEYDYLLSELSRVKNELKKFEN